MSESINSISEKKIYSLDDAINMDIESKTVFIISNEIILKSNKIGRYFTIFPSFKDFLKKRKLFPHCHEILVDHKNNEPNISGRLVFDFDIKNIDVPKDFKDNVEHIIIEVVETYFEDVDTNILQFVWSSNSVPHSDTLFWKRRNNEEHSCSSSNSVPQSDTLFRKQNNELYSYNSTSINPIKFSKHLTIKNLYFDNWIELSKIFYQLFCIKWDEYYDWIPSTKLIDFQIVRNRASLRMVGSSKINGYPLVLDDDKFCLEDSLIRLYSNKQKRNEKLITKVNIKNDVFENVLAISDSHPQYVGIFLLNKAQEQGHISNNDLKITECYIKTIREPLYDIKVYKKAFKIYNKIHPNVFTFGKISGEYISLLRIKADKCIFSGKIHENENAYIKISKINDMYSIYFGCFRYCNQKIKIIQIGTISVNNLQIYINPEFIDN